MNRTLLGQVDPWQVIGPKLIDERMRAGESIILKVIAERKEISVEFFPEKWGGNFGTDSLGFIGKLIIQGEEHQNSALMLTAVDILNHRWEIFKP